MTNNPCAVESTPTGLRAYFVPEDDEKATLYIYDIEVGPSDKTDKTGKADKAIAR